MVRFLYDFPTKLSRGGAFGLALVLPALVGPAFFGFSNNEETAKGKTNILKGLEVSQLSNSEKDQSIDTKPSALSSDDTQPNDAKKNKSNESRVLISEVTIQGLDDHPDKELLEFAAYDAMSVRPGSKISKEELKVDLEAIYSSGWFSGVRLEPINGLRGVQLLVKVEPNPVLKKVDLSPENLKISPSTIDGIFRPDYGKTLNLNSFQARVKQLRSWYVDRGYSLTRISGPNRITKDGIVELNVVEGVVAGIDVKFLNADGESTNADGKRIKGKTKLWVVKREISIEPGDIFNRNKLESDIKTIYGTSLFSDVKVTLKPVAGEPGKITIVLGITEQSTGSLSGGIGYSGGQGAFGQIGVQSSNLLGRSWKTALDLTYGQYGALVNFSFTDPWIKGDKYRTSFRQRLFISREVPQEFRSQYGGSIVDASKGNSIFLQRTGGGFSFSRSLNGGDPYKRVPWRVLAGMNIQQVNAVNYAGKSRPYGVLNDDDQIICVAYECSDVNNLFSLTSAATYNTLNNSKNPTSGDFLSFGTEQFITVGDHSPTFNRLKTSYSHFFPVNWLKISKGCRPDTGEKANCPQTIGFQAKAGAIVGDFPPYEAFCLGGSSSVRGWNNCDLAVGRNFGEASVEYRLPIWKLISAAFFIEGATDFGSQSEVPGKPGKLLGKNGSGFSPGAGLIVNTPVGPLRLEGARRDWTGGWRFNLGVGWKF